MNTTISPILRYRQILTTIHVVIAGFFLPVAIMFAVTGGLYTFGVKGEYETKKLSLPLTMAAEPKLSELITAAEAILKEHNNGEVPTGSPGIKKAGTSWQFEWTGSNYDFTLDPTTTAGTYNVAIKETSAHRFFVQLHKAKGGLPFKILAGGLAAGLLALFFGGVLLAFSSPILKKKLYASFIFGAAAFAATAVIS